MGLSDVLCARLVHHLTRQLDRSAVPRHVGVILDGNRRWASRGAGASEGHQAGADKIAKLLAWCDEVGVEVVTLWLLSTDNLNRPEKRAAAAAGDHREGRRHPGGHATLADPPGGRARPAAGRTRRAAQGRRGRHPRRRRDARQRRGRVRRAARDRRRGALAAAGAGRPGTTLEELAEVIDVEHIAEHLYTKGQPDPDLVIRTSGEQRLGGFLLWQSAHSEFYFCEAYWPDFRRVDFLRALRAYAERDRRFGS